MLVDSSPLLQQEIFGRFVLLEQLDAHGPETCRAIDLDRELQPVVTVRRQPRWGSFTRRERLAFVAASQLRARAHGELLAMHVDAGELEDVPYWATQYVPGLSIDRLIERAIDRGGLSKGLALTTAYCVAACLLDLSADRFDRSENTLVAPLIHPRRFILSWSGRPIFLGTSYEQAAPDDEEKRFSPPDFQGRIKAAADAFGLAGLVYEMCTGLPFSSAAHVDNEGPLGAVPVELRRSLQKAITMDHAGVRELMHLIEPLMKAAGGGHFSEVGRELELLASDVKNQEAVLLDKDAALAKRLRKRITRARPSEASTMKLRLRPASQEGPAFVERPPENGELPEEMVFVAGGRYLFGSFGSESMPPSYVDVEPYLIDRHPVTNAEYHRYVTATGAPLPAAWNGRYPEELARCPVVGVPPQDAEAYARWTGKRLPSEVEWELAARGFDGRPWPWGHEFERDRTTTTWMQPWKSRVLPPVGSHPSGDSPFGVGDLGQAWEWTSTEHVTGARIVRGGPWRNRIEPFTLSNRSHESTGSPDVTFRCCRSIAVPRVGLGVVPPPVPARTSTPNPALSARPGEPDSKDDADR
jgi:formylglycine-generating enzyme required for sulfatase activity